MDTITVVPAGTRDREMAMRTKILLVPAGSTLHGLNLPGKDDEDQLGVCVEDMDRVAGFSQFDQYIYRTATERTGKNDEPSRPGDLDLVIYGLRKFLRLVMQGNPQLVQTLFVPWNRIVFGNDTGLRLQELAPYIVSKECGARYLGYLESQRQRLLGERGQKKVNRPELEAKHGFDTKYAMHILRLGYQGVELLSTGRLTLPMAEKDRTYVYDCRLGKLPLQEVLTRAGELETQIKDLITDGPLRESPAREVVEEWMIDTYRQAWG